MFSIPNQKYCVDNIDKKGKKKKKNALHMPVLILLYGMIIGVTNLNISNNRNFIEHFLLYFVC